MAEPVQKQISGKSDFISFAFSLIPSKKNEDRTCHKLSHTKLGESGISCFGMFDGHSGKNAASYCAKTLNGNIISKYRQLQCGNDDGDSLSISDAIFCEAARRCCEEIDFEVKCAYDSGTTMLSLFVMRRPDASIRVYCPWIGDTKCIMYKIDENGSKVLYRMTEDHTPYLPREKKRIENKESVEWRIIPVEVDISTFQSSTITPEKNLVKFFKNNNFINFYKKRILFLFCFVLNFTFIF